MRRTFIVLLLPLVLFAQTFYATPKPSFEHPRKWLIRLNTKDLHTVNHTLGAIYNVLKAYPSDALEVLVVAYGPGIRVLRKDYDKHTLKRIKSLMAYDVQFEVCKNTMETMHWTKKEFIDGVSYVQTGVAEVIERKAAGWIEVTPY